MISRGPVAPGNLRRLPEATVWAPTGRAAVEPTGPEGVRGYARTVSEIGAVGGRVLQVLDAAAVRRWASRALDAVGREREHIDALNVFPVPDGDTGTNLFLTIEAARQAVDDLDADRDDFGATMRALAHGAFLGARGNSGVIVSQILRGMSDAVAAEPGLPGVDGRLLGIALVRASRAAYAAVGSPVEGTILTVVRDVAEAVAAVRTGDLVTVTRAALDGATASLLRTPDQLAVLREHGVVDAGGAGLVVMLGALLEVVTGVTPTDAARVRLPLPQRPVRAIDSAPPDPTRGPGFEVMYLLEADESSLVGLRLALEPLGDSLLVVGGDGLWNVHIHVDDVGAALEAGLAVGRPYRIRVEPLTIRAGRIEPTNRSDDPAAGVPSFVAPDGCAVAPGRGVVAIVEGVGLAELVAQAGAVPVTTAPGTPLLTRTVLAAIHACAAPEVLVIPADRTVRAAAEAAAAEAREVGIRVAVIPVRAVVQGLAALAVHDADRRFDDDVVAMTAAAGATRVAEVLVAVERAMTMVGVCEPGDVLGLVDGDVVLVASDPAKVASDLLDRLLGGGGELVTMVHGAGPVGRSAAAVRNQLHADRPDVECVAYDAGAARDLLLLGVE